MRFRKKEPFRAAQCAAKLQFDRGPRRKGQIWTTHDSNVSVSSPSAITAYAKILARRIGRAYSGPRGFLIASLLIFWSAVFRSVVLKLPQSGKE